jgi:hypothetical protein
MTALVRCPNGYPTEWCRHRAVLEREVQTPREWRPSRAWIEAGMGLLAAVVGMLAVFA